MRKKEFVCNEVFSGDVPCKYGVTIVTPYFADLLTTLQCTESL
jgi:hypothetical protein